MKALLVMTWLLSLPAFAVDSLERDYVGKTDEGEECSVRLRDSQGSANFHYREDGKSKSCSITYDRYYLTDMLNNDRPFGTVKSKSGFTSCKVQVYFTADEKVKRLRMGLKSIFNPFHVYKDCNLP